MKNIEEFVVKVSEKDIDLLNKKIDLTRWPDEINHRWSHGTDLNFLKELTNYWRNEFNWRDHEKKINDIGSYRYTTKSRLKLHFLHSKSNNNNAIPLVYVFCIYGKCFIYPYFFFLFRRCKLCLYACFRRCLAKCSIKRKFT